MHIHILRRSIVVIVEIKNIYFSLKNINDVVRIAGKVLKKAKIQRKLNGAGGGQTHRVRFSHREKFINNRPTTYI